MKRSCVVVVSVLLCLSTLCSANLSWLEIPKYDGVKRIELLADAVAYRDLVRGPQEVVVVLEDDLLKEPFAEKLAQVLAAQPVKVYAANDSVISEFHHKTPNTFNGSVLVYRQGRRFTYRGRRCVNAVLRYVQEMQAVRVTPIVGKLDKMAFDKVHKTKLVGFFVNGTVDHKVYQEAAALFGSVVPFYEVYDRTVAKHLKLDTVGQIGVYRPHHKQPVLCAGNPATLSDIQSLIVLNRGASIVEVNEMNVFDPSLIESSKMLVMAMGDSHSPLDVYLHRMLDRLVKNDSLDFQHLHILWIDADRFPMVRLIPQDIKTAWKIPDVFPLLGKVNLTTGESTWFNMAVINITADKTSDEQNFLFLREWFATLVNSSTTFQMFNEVPLSQEVVEGTSVTMTCTVRNKVGDCLWLKDSQPIGYSMQGYPHISWRTPNSPEDCSIVFSDVVRGRDDGRWSCQVTGGAQQQLITSPSAQLVITAPEAATAQAKTEL